MLSQIGELYQKNHLEGKVLIQVFPAGDWKKIASFPEINKFLEKVVLGQDTSAADDTNTDSTVARISLAKLKEAERKKKKESELEEKKKKLEELESETQKEEHKEFRFTREEPSQLVDYEELEKKFKLEEDDKEEAFTPEEEAKEEAKEEIEEEGVEKTVILKRPNLEPDSDKTQVNPEALKWFKEQEIKKKKDEEEKKRLEEEAAEAQENAESSISFDESTQFIDRGALVSMKHEAKELEREIKEDEEKKEIEKRKENEEFEEEVEEEEEGPKKKKMSPIVALAFLVIIWFLFEEDDVPKEFQPAYLRIKQPITLQVADKTKSEEMFRKGLQNYRSGTYVGKLKAYAFFHKSIEYKFNSNPALGYLILVSGELFDNVAERSKGKSAEILFKLIKITRSKTYKDVNIAMGTALFYKNNGKINSAVNVLEKYLRISQPSLKLLSLYLDMAISQGDLVKARDVMEKLKPYDNKPLEAFLAMSRFHTLDERYDDGESVIREGLKKFPSSVALLLELSEYQLRKEDISSYKSTLQKCAKLKHEYSPKYYAKYLESVGILAAFNKNTKQAAGFFKMALIINDTDELRSKLASLEIGGGTLAEKLILESKAIDLIRKSKKLVKERKWESAFNAAIEASDLEINFLPSDLNLAYLQIKRGFYESAIETLTFLKKEYPIHPGVSFALIKAYYESNKIDEAQLEVGMISNTKLRTHRLYNSTVGHFYAKAGKPALAIKFLGTSVRENPLRDQDYFLMAQIYAKSRQYKESKAKLSEAITLDPLNIEYKSLYGNILFELEGAETAIGYLQTTLNEYKDNPRLMGDMAIAYYRNGQIAQFREIKERVGKLNTDDPAFYEFMIKAARIEENTDNQIKYAEELLEIDPGDVETRMLLGNSYSQLGQYRKALDAYDKVAKRLSTYPKVFYAIAKVYIKVKDYKNAMEAAKKEKENNPKIYHGYYIYGEIQRLLGTQESVSLAVKNLEKAISINPQNVESLMSLGWIKLSQRNHEIARELYLRAKRQEPSNPEIRKQLGFVYQGIGQSGLAIEEFQTYLKLYPNAPDRNQVLNQIRVLSR
ncbi:MAG: tetratricopeptide repeat protein [Halobacteriovoraceae bacterium]|nr:tetratricopeptide repeat protein [Halobacteriovoraceae bacterium]